MVMFVFSTFDVPGQYAGTIAYVGGVNDFGQIAGTFTDASGKARIFVRTGGRYDTALVSQADGGLRVSGLNNLDLVVGSTYTSFYGQVVTQQFDPFSGRFGQAQTLTSPFPNYPVTGGVNDFGEVIGNSELVIPSGTTPGTSFSEQGGTITALQLPPGPDGAYLSEPNAINDSGQITGWYDTIAGTSEMGSVGFVDTNGTIQTIVAPGFTSTNPTAINNLGEVAGTASIGPYGAGVGFVDIGGQITTFQYPGATTTVVTGINDLGQVVGEYYKEGAVYTAGPFVATPVRSTDQ